MIERRAFLRALVGGLLGWAGLACASSSTLERPWTAPLELDSPSSSSFISWRWGQNSWHWQPNPSQVWSALPAESLSKAPVSWWRGRSRSWEVAIVGAGVTGLSCARSLSRQGEDDFLLLDFYNQAGGCARSLAWDLSWAPWGAARLALPHLQAENEDLLGYLEELGIIEGWDSAGRPRYEAASLLHDPAERLLSYGRWVFGLYDPQAPQLLSPQEGQNFQSWLGELLKAPPSASWANLSWEAFLQRFPGNREWVKLLSRLLLGPLTLLPLSSISASAVLQYLRRYGSPDQPLKLQGLSWPQGLQRLLQPLIERFSSRLVLNSLVYGLERQGKYWQLRWLQLPSLQAYRLQAKRIVLTGALPLAARLLAPLWSWQGAASPRAGAAFKSAILPPGGNRPESYQAFNANDLAFCQRLERHPQLLYISTQNQERTAHPRSHYLLLRRSAQEYGPRQLPALQSQLLAEGEIFDPHFSEASHHFWIHNFPAARAPVIGSHLPPSLPSEPGLYLKLGDLTPWPNFARSWRLGLLKL